MSLLSWSIISIILFAIIELSLTKQHKNQSVTIVTGLWDIGRSERNFKTYYGKFLGQLLDTNENFVVYGNQSQTKDLVFKIRNQENTVYIPKTLQDIQSMWYSKLMKKQNAIMKRQTPLYYLRRYYTAIQFNNQNYMPIMITKFYMLKDTVEIQKKKFNSDYVLWADAGGIHIFGKKAVVSPDSRRRSSYTAILKIAAPDFFFVGGQYAGYQEPYMNWTRYMDAVQDQRFVGTFFGGRNQVMNQITNIFQNLLKVSFQNFDITTDEAVMRIMHQRYPYLFPNKPNLTLYFLHKVQFWNIHTTNVKPSRFHQYKLQQFAEGVQEKSADHRFYLFTKEKQDVPKQNRYQFIADYSMLAVDVMINTAVFVLLFYAKKLIDTQIFQMEVNYCNVNNSRIKLSQYEVDQ